MNKLIDPLFKIADVLAWVLVTASILSVLLMPFTEPDYYALRGLETQWGTIGIKAFCSLLVAIGFYLYIKRKIVSFFFISLAFVGSAFVTASLSVIWMLACVLALFSLPWVLSFIAYKRGYIET
mgnify:CR=1 FL=1